MPKNAPNPGASKRQFPRAMQLYLTEDQHEWLRRKAFEERRDMTEILRELIEKARQ